jgi:type IV secretory pathway TraG/TraD family ATPase VirD4
MDEIAHDGEISDLFFQNPLSIFVHKGHWASFIGNAGVRALFSLDDYETAEYWSKFIGGHLVATTTEQRDIWGLTQGSSGGEAARPLIRPEEIMLRFARDKMIVLKQGARPIEVDRISYWLDKTLAGLWDDPRAV